MADAMYSSCNFVRTGGGAALERTPNRIWLIALPYLVLLGGSAAIVNWGLTHQEGSASATMLIDNPYLLVRSNLDLVQIARRQPPQVLGCIGNKRRCPRVCSKFGDRLLRSCDLCKQLSASVDVA